MTAYKLQLKIAVMPLITMIIMVSVVVLGGPGPSLPEKGWEEVVLCRGSGCWWSGMRLPRPGGTWREPVSRTWVCWALQAQPLDSDLRL